VPYKRDHILQERPTVWRSLLIAAPSYFPSGEDILQTAQAFVAICYGMHCIHTHIHLHITRTRMLISQKMIGVCVCGRKYVWQKIIGLFCFSDRQKRPIIFCVCVAENSRFLLPIWNDRCVRVWLRIRWSSVFYCDSLHTHIHTGTYNAHTHTEKTERCWEQMFFFFFGDQRFVCV